MVNVFILVHGTLSCYCTTFHSNWKLRQNISSVMSL